MAATSPPTVIAVFLPSSSPVCIRWARRWYRRPSARWAVRAVGETGLAVIAGWEDATFGTYTVARSAADFIEETGGSFEAWYRQHVMEKKRRARAARETRATREELPGEDAAEK